MSPRQTQVLEIEVLSCMCHTQATELCPQAQARMTLQMAFFQPLKQLFLQHACAAVPLPHWTVWLHQGRRLLESCFLGVQSSFSFKQLIIFMCMRALPVCTCVHHTCAVSMDARRGCDPLEPGFRHLWVIKTRPGSS